MVEDKNLLMVTVSGPDRPGITARFTHVLMEHQVEVVDMEQASLQDLLGLYFLLDLSVSSGSKDSVIKDLLFEASHLNLTLHFRLFSETELRGHNDRNLFVLTHFGGTRAIAELSAILSEENVNIETISTFNHHGIRSMELVIDARDAFSLARLKQRLMLKSRELGVDLALQKIEAHRKNKRLIFFDMDSTLVDAEIIDRMAAKKGVHREVARITEKAMRGDLDFEESIVQRLALLKGLNEEDLLAIRDSIPLSKGVEELVKTLKWLGFKLGLVTGGFDFFADHFRAMLGLDFAYSNRLEIKNGAVTGRVLGEILDAAGKARIVNQVSCEMGISLDQVVVVGDGANDALMIGQAGLGIAYNARHRLDRVANGSLGKSRLNHLYHLLGITESDIEKAVCKYS
ncbi:MAG: phosphoserine phosphatase SerB [Desulfobacteraceae bacterium]|jgi:phosphoserine phosphatase|nr:MAG: phosphoserine phosphatase SerB [Desulfobacteraceae bacterium]